MTIRSNPKYQNICWTRVGTYRNNACDKCSKKEECDATMYKDGVPSIPIRKISKPVPKVKIGRRISKVPQWIEKSQDINKGVSKLILPDGIVYTNKLIIETKIMREVICAWLKHNGFKKSGRRNSKRWVNKDYVHAQLS